MAILLVLRNAINIIYKIIANHLVLFFNHHKEFAMNAILRNTPVTRQDMNLGLQNLRQHYLIPWVSAFILAFFMVGSSIAQEAASDTEGEATPLDAQASSTDGALEAEASDDVDASDDSDLSDYGAEEYVFPEGELIYKDAEPEDVAGESEMGAEDAAGDEVEEEGFDYSTPDEELPEVEMSAWDVPPPIESEDAEPTEAEVEAEADNDILPEEEPLSWDSEADKEGVTADATDDGMVGEDITPSGISMEGSVDRYISRKWLEFSFKKINTPARGCWPSDRGGSRCAASRAKNSVFANAPAWTFNTSSHIRVYVTDAFDRNDRFKVYDSGKLLGETSKPRGSGNCGSDPARCYRDKSASSGYFDLNPGKHALTIVPSVNSGGAAYFLVAKRSAPTKSRGVLQFHSRSYRVRENSRSIAVIVTRRGGKYGTVSVRYGTSNGSARSGKDYKGRSGRLIWRNGDSRAKVIRVNIINDSVRESTEYFRVNLGRVTGGAKLGSSRTTSVSILDDDRIPPISSKCHAVFTAKDRKLFIPLINMPLLDPITGRPVGKAAVFKGTLELVEGVEDFKVLPNSMSFVKMLTKNNKCHASYSYTNRRIHIPYLNVPSVMVVPPNVVAPGPTQVFQAYLQQLPLSDDIFHLIHYRYRYTIKK